MINSNNNQPPQSHFGQTRSALMHLNMYDFDANISRFWLLLR